MKVNTKAIQWHMSRKLLTKGGLAESAGLSRGTISNIFRKGFCSVSTARVICYVLEVEPSEIIEKDDE